MTAVVAATLFASLGVGTFPASAAPADSSADKPAVPAPAAAKGSIDANSAKLSDSLKPASNGRHSVFVQFAGTGAADASAAVASKGKAKQKATAKAKRLSLKSQTASRGLDRQVQGSGRSGSCGPPPTRFPASRSTPTQAAIDALAARSDVVKIIALGTEDLSNSSAAATDQGAQHLAEHRQHR